MKYLLIILLYLNTLYLFPQEKDSVVNSKKNFEMQKNPTTAILYSLIFPGAGQIYTEDYWKTPVFAIGAGVLVFLIVDNNNKYKEYQALYDIEVVKSKISTATTRYKSYKEYFRDMRDQSAFYLGAVYILAAVDAYAGAHLFDFNVSDQVKLNISPEFSPLSSKVSFKFEF